MQSIPLSCRGRWWCAARGAKRIEAGLFAEEQLATESGKLPLDRLREMEIAACGH